LYIWLQVFSIPEHGATSSYVGVPLLHPWGIVRLPLKLSGLLGSTRDSSHEWSTGWKDKAAYTTAEFEELGRLQKLMEG
jgi:hypothetical protein